MNDNIVIYHDNCQDGFASATIAKFSLNNNARLLSAQYGDSIPPKDLLKDNNVYILDFSYPREELLRIKELASSIKVIDHHKTAEEDCKGLNFCTFDMEHCGAYLTWQYFVGGDPSTFIKYIEDRDLWQWKLPESKEFHAGLSIYGYDFDMWEGFIFRDQFQHLYNEGKAILLYQKQQIEKMLQQRRGYETIGGYNVPVINTNHLISEKLNVLCRGYPFAAAYFYVISDKNERKKVYSLRSDKFGIDVSKVAKSLGGGGHKNAAGFEMYLR